MTSSFAINQPDDLTILEVPTEILCSYHYFSEIDMGEVARWGTSIIGDSGAFSAMSLGKPIDREEFHEWVSRWNDDLLWAAALDVIGDPEESFLNWEAARRDGLDLVPTIHFGEGTDQLDRFAESGATLIGLGGMVPHRGEQDKLMRWCLKMHRHARDHHPQVRFHGWGISHPYLVDNLPWWSTDSSGFTSCFRFGTLRVWHPKRGKFCGVDLNGRDMAKHSTLLREVYGVDWKLISRSVPENRRALGRVAIRSVQLYAEWLQKRQQVTPPQLLLDRKYLGVGPKQFIADTSHTVVLGPRQVPAIVQNDVFLYGLGVTESSEIPRSGGPRQTSADTSHSIHPGPTQIPAVAPIDVQKLLRPPGALESSESAEK